MKKVHRELTLKQYAKEWYEAGQADQKICKMDLFRESWCMENKQYEIKIKDCNNEETI